MRKFWALAAGLLLGLAMVGSCSAANSVTMQVVVHASVLPARYIVINANNQIAEIISNTELPVVPQVYSGSITPAHQRALTAAVYSQYLTLLKQPGSSNQLTGILYLASPNQSASKPATNPNNTSLASINSRPHGLFFLKSVGVDSHA